VQPAASRANSSADAAAAGGAQPTADANNASFDETAAAAAAVSPMSQAVAAAPWLRLVAAETPAEVHCAP